jgi:hypothetical protein
MGDEYNDDARDALELSVRSLVSRCFDFISEAGSFQANGTYDPVLLQRRIGVAEEILKDTTMLLNHPDLIFDFRSDAGTPAP